MGSDFFDDDVSQKDSASFRTHDSGDSISLQPLTETSVKRMTRQKEEVAANVAQAMEEMEKLRMRQDELEKEKSRLHDIARKQDEYEQGKRDIMEKLDRGIISIEKEEIEATRMVALLSETRSKFRATLADLRNINEETWAESSFNEELNKALAVIENARMDYKKAIARIDASSWHKSPAANDQSGMLDSIVGGSQGVSTDFGTWLKVGLAVTLPLIAILSVFFVILVAMGGGVR